MHILHIYSGNLYGGVESNLLTLAVCSKGFPDFQQDFALCYQDRLWMELSSVGATLHDLGKTNWRFPNSIISARTRLENLLQTGRYDTVICHSPWTLGIFGPIVRRLDLKLV